MRRFSSIYSSFKFLSSAVFLVIVISACQKNSERVTTQRDATGKGNGGNKLTLTAKEVEQIFTNLKPKLKRTFEALAYLAQAEKAAPKATELGQIPSLQKTLLKLIEGDPKATVFSDIDSDGNLALQGEPCRDFRGVANAAAAVLMDFGGKICFSSGKIRTVSLRNFDKAAEVYVIALAAHEFTHHFISTGDHNADEKAAQEVQNFVEEQLIRSLEIEAKDVISVGESAYIDRFHQYARDIFQGATGQP